MTKTQEKYFNFIKNRLIANKVSPTYAEIANHFGVSISTVQTQINNLIKLGEIGRTPNIKGGLYLITDKAKFWKSKYEELLTIQKNYD